MMDQHENRATEPSGSAMNPPGSPPMGRPKPTIAIACGVVAAGLGAVLVYALTVVVGLGQAVPLLIVGPMVGLAMRFTSPPMGKTLGVVAIVLAVLGAMAGFMWADAMIWTPYMVEQSVQRLFSLTGVVMLGVSGYLAWVIAPTR